MSQLLIGNGIAYLPIICAYHNLWIRGGCVQIVMYMSESIICENNRPTQGTTLCQASSYDFYRYYLKNGLIGIKLPKLFRDQCTVQSLNNNLGKYLGPMYILYFIKLTFVMSPKALFFDGCFAGEPSDLLFDLVNGAFVPTS